MKNRLEQEREREYPSRPCSVVSPVASRLVSMPDATIVAALKLILTWMTMRSLDTQKAGMRKRRSMADSYFLASGRFAGSFVIIKWVHGSELMCTRELFGRTVLAKLSQNIYHGERYRVRANASLCWARWVSADNLLENMPTIVTNLFLRASYEIQGKMMKQREIIQSVSPTQRSTHYRDCVKQFRNENVLRTFI